MKDRVSATPGRMLITPENGQPAFYATVELADNPSVEGTPLNKANLLTDATAALFGLGSDAVPDDVLTLCTRISVGSYVGTGTYGAGNPNIIQTNFAPKLAIIMRGSSSITPDSNGGWSQSMLASYQASLALVDDGTSGNNNLTWGDTFLSWYTLASGTNAPSAQLNAAGVTYNWLILG